MTSFYNEFKDCNHRQIDVAFIQACQQNDLPRIKYLLISPELKRNADIHCGNDGVIDTLCSYSSIGILQFLLNSSELKDNLSIVSQNNKLFQKAIICNRRDILHYLIVDCELEKSENVQKILDRFSNKNGNFLNARKDLCQTVELMFENRDLKQSLSVDLNYNKDRKQVKI